MQDFITNSFYISLKIMKILRLYKDGNSTICFKIQGFLMYFVLLVIASLLTIAKLMLDNDMDTYRMSTMVTYLCETTCFTFKLLPFLFYGSKIKNCIYYFANSQFMPKGKTEEKIINDCVIICQRNATVYAIGVFAALVDWIFRPLFSQGYNLPIEPWLPYDVKTSQKVYYATFFFFAVASSYDAFSGTLIDPLIGGLAYHATGQLKILKHNLQNLNKCQQLHGNCQTTYNRIRKCAKHYEGILKFVKEYEECFTWCIFSQFGGSLFGMCFCLFRLSKIPLTDPFAIGCILQFFVIMWHMFFYCYYGQLLYDENNNIVEAIYMGEWYNYNLTCKKSLLILMERSKKPLIVTTGKIIQLTLETFTMTLKRSYSLVAVLQNFV